MSGDTARRSHMLTDCPTFPPHQAAAAVLSVIKLINGNLMEKSNTSGGGAVLLSTVADTQQEY